MIRKESKLADLIVSAGLIGNVPVLQAGSQPAEVERPSRPCSAPTSRRSSSSSSRQLSRANSRAAVILGLQATTNRRSTGLASDRYEHDNATDSPCFSSRAAGDHLQQRNHIPQPFAAWQEPLLPKEPDLDAFLQQLQAERQQQDEQQQRLFTEVKKLNQQLTASQTAVQELETQLHQQQDQHQQTLSDLQAQADDSSKKLFRELKAAEAAKEQALAGKRNAERANRDLQQELAALQAHQQQQQQQSTLLEERLATANKKLEQQSQAYDDAKQRAAAVAHRQQEQLKQKLKVQEETLKEAEESLRYELQKRTSTILNMQAELQGKGAALQEAAVEQQALQERLQELEQQLSATLSAPPSLAPDVGEDQPPHEEDQPQQQQQQQQHQQLAIQAGHKIASQQPGSPTEQQHSPHCCKCPVLERQLKLTAAVPAAAAADASVLLPDLATRAEDCCLSPRLIDIDTSCDNSSGSCTSRSVAAAAAGGGGGGGSSKVTSRPVAASVQLLRQSLQMIQGGVSSSESVKVLAAQVEGLTAALAGAQKEMARLRQEYAQELQQLSGVTAAAEAAAAACWRSYDVTFGCLTRRVTQLLQDQCKDTALPFHRPRSAAAAAAVVVIAGQNQSVGIKQGQMFGRNARPASARPATAAASSSSTVEQQQQKDDGDDRDAFGDEFDKRCNQQRPGSPDTGGGSSNKQQMQGSGVYCNRPWTAGSSSSSNRGRNNSMGPCCSPRRPCSAAAATGSSSSSSIHALQQMNERLCAENALLLVELSKWEAGHHHKQMALAVAAKQQARFSSTGVADQLAVHIADSSRGIQRVRHAAGLDADQVVVVEAADDDGDRSDSCGDDTDWDDGINHDDQQQQQQQFTTASVARNFAAVVKHNPATAAAAAAAHKSGMIASSPVKQALQLAVTEALQAGKGAVLPALLLQGLAAAHTTSSSGGWTAAGSSRLAAALSAAEINLKLRTRVVHLESCIAGLHAAHAGDDTQSYQQQQRVKQLEALVNGLTAQLAEAKLSADNAQEKMQQSLAVAAAAVVQPHSQQLHKHPAEQHQGLNQKQVYVCSAAATAATAGSSGEVLSCGGGGLLQDLPIAVQQEIAAQRRIAAAAKHDKEVYSRTLTQLELRYSSLASKLVKTRQAVANRDVQIAQLQQALAAAHNALLDAGVDLQQQQQQQQQQGAAAAAVVTQGMFKSQQCREGGVTVCSAAAAAAGSSDSGSDDVMSMVLSADVSHSSFCSSQLGGSSSSSMYSSAAAANAAAAASWSAAMEGRERQRQLQRLTADCADKQQRIQSLQQQVKKLQQQLSKQQRAADAAVAAVTAEENSRRESLANGKLEQKINKLAACNCCAEALARSLLQSDLEGATVAMQDATKKLAAKEMQCMELQQQLAAALRRQQQLEFDVSYLRSRRAAGGAVGPGEAAAAALVATEAAVDGGAEAEAAQDESVSSLAAARTAQPFRRY